MCLHTKEKAEIANKDIVCYKILVKNKANNIYTPFMKERIIIKNTYTSFLQNNNGDVSKGLHSMATLCDANALLARIKPYFESHELVMAKCIIPKGSSYYKGTFSRLCGFASNQLTYIELITT